MLVSFVITETPLSAPARRYQPRPPRRSPIVKQSSAATVGRSMKYSTLAFVSNTAKPIDSAKAAAATSAPRCE